MHWLNRITIPIFMVVIFFNGCAYYNTFYNAKTYYAEAQKATELNQTGTVSRDEIQLYAKAIDKSKRLLTKFPESEYCDDAQFIIARSYYYRQDYRLARRYFEELATQYPDSPFTAEVPLWLGRCLMQQADLVMAKHEAKRTIEKSREPRIHVESYLLLGQIAIAEDSLALARHYLERVISESRNGETQAEAQFQIGNLLKEGADYEGALKAYQDVSRYSPSENLKIQSIINQNRMLQKLEREHEAIEMIKVMLLDEKFQDIQGQLEVELGKAYYEEGWDDEAISRFKRVMEEYRNKPVAAEAAYWLGELYLNHFHQYKEASEAYGSVTYHDRKSEFVPIAEMRKKQIQRYNGTQAEYRNLQRELIGRPPEDKAQANQNPPRGATATTGKRPHGRLPGTTPNQAIIPEDNEPIETKIYPNVAAFDLKVIIPEDNEPIETLHDSLPEQSTALPDDSLMMPTVSRVDSLRISEEILRNQYALAEQFVFNFHFYDSTRVLLNMIEKTTRDSGLIAQAAFMRYYLAAEIEHDSTAAMVEKSHIQTNYPALYEKFFVVHEKPAQPLQSEADFMAAEKAFLADHDREMAAQIYERIVADSSRADSPWRERSLFNLGWMYDHYLMNQDKATGYYSRFLKEYPESELVNRAQERLNLIAPKGEIETSKIPDPQETQIQAEQPERPDPQSRDRDPNKAEEK